MGQRNTIVGLVLVVFSTGYGALALRLPERNIEGTPGPGFFPALTAAILIGLSVALVVQGVRGRRRAGGPAAAPGRPDRRPAAVLGIFAIYIALLPVAGFVVASVPFAGAMMRLFGGRNPLLIAAGAIALPVLLSLLFGEVFRIPLPHGSWTFPGG